MDCCGRLKSLAAGVSAAVAILALALPAKGADGKLPVPDAAARQAATERIKTLYKEKIAAAETPSQKSALAREMIAVAGKTTQDADGRFALLQYAARLAASACDLDAAESAVEGMAEHHDMDVLRNKAALLRTLAESPEAAADPVEMRLRVASLAASLFEKAVEDENVDAADRLVDAGRVAVAAAGPEADALATKAQAEAEKAEKKAARDIAAAKTVSAKSAAKAAATKAGKAAAEAKQRADEARAAADRVDQAAKRLAEWKALFGPAQEALAILKAHPTHAPSNLKVGQYRCFVQRDWARGLKHLALGSDRDLQGLAQRESAPLDVPGERIALAKAWHARAAAAEGAEKFACLTRARMHYAAALDKLDGLQKVEVEKHLLEIRKTVPDEKPREDLEPGFSCRSIQNRRRVLALLGGGKLTEEAVERGLEWLAKNQNRDGSWSLSGPFSGGVDRSADNQEAATAMALLAFQGRGDTHKDGVYKNNVANGWKWLAKQQDEEGNFFHSGPKNHRYYTQGQCTIAACELYGMTQDPKVRTIAEKAVDNLIKAQSPEGGWRYEPNNDSDVSVTGWVVTALQTAKMAGLKVPDETFNRVQRYLDNVGENEGTRYPYKPGGRVTPTMTAEAMLCRQYLGWPRNDKRLVSGATWITSPENLISFTPERRSVYYWYYATQFTRQMEGEHWRRWNAVMSKLIPEHQVQRGKEAGSWDPRRPCDDKWADLGGRLYVTCLSIYMLEVYYRHPPIYQQAAEN